MEVFLSGMIQRFLRFIRFEIARNWNKDKSIVFTNEAVEFIKFLTGASKDTIIQNHWLDVEPLYRENGYEVTYHESQGNESFPSYYEFRKKSLNAGFE